MLQVLVIQTMELRFWDFLSLTLLLCKNGILISQPKNRKIKNDNNTPERIAIKKNSVVNSASKKYKYIYIYSVNMFWLTMVVMIVTMSNT